MRRGITLLTVVAVVFLLAAGAVGGAAADSTPASAAECEDASDNELVGCWNGTHYEDDLGIDQADGLTEDELEALTHLKMARVEYIRERPFKEAVPVDTMTRQEFQEDFAGDDEETEADREFNRWNDGVWKALFVVGEDDSSADAIDAVFGGAVGGFYSPAENRIVLVVDEGEDLQISGSTLVHELGHAMQDQYHDLAHPRYAAATQDEDLAIEGIVEGEVVYFEEVYDEYCEESWSCLGEPDTTDGGDDLPENFNYGILQTVLQPYSDGVFYAEELIERDGWDAVNESMNDPPETSSEVIHRDPDFETREIAFEDTAVNGWETYPDQGVDGAETAGEASVFVMFWYQSFEYGAATLEGTAQESVNVHLQTDRDLRTRQAYNYAHEATEGWKNDELYPYRNDEGDDQRDGYVWVTEWDTEADAEQFHETYLRMLDAHDAEQRADGVHHVTDGDFRGAYGVERDGTTVTIAHGLDPDDVFELRPDIDLDEPEETPTPADTPTPSDGTSTPDEETPTPANDTDETTPGFGVPAALVALVAALAAATARRS